VSRVSVFSALKGVTITRWSTQMVTESISGISQNRPAPRSPWNLPRRSTTAFSHWRAMRSEYSRMKPISIKPRLPTSVQTMGASVSSM
jgi:hypothetical protein